MFLGFFLQNVLPHEFGIKQHFYFLFTAEFWGIENNDNNDINILLEENKINQNNNKEIILTLKKLLKVRKLKIIMILNKLN